MDCGGTRWWTAVQLSTSSCKVTLVGPATLRLADDELD